MQTIAASPYLPDEGIELLDDLAFDLVREANALAGQLHPLVRGSFEVLFRSIDSYYSSQLEGDAVEPGDIRCALRPGYSSEGYRRDMQLRLRAHMDVQQMIDERNDSASAPTTRESLEWVHREFYSRLPESSRVMLSADVSHPIRVIPGEIRDSSVVSDLSKPAGDELPLFLARFRQAYQTTKLSKPRQLIAVAAAHHRLLWMQPFVAGNSRVAQLMTHAMLLELGVNPSLWSLSRGLMHDLVEYQKRSAAADAKRLNDRDGEGALSHAGLTDFCEFFLATCLVQVKTMRRLLEPIELQRRVEFYARDEEDARRLPKGSTRLLREVLISGELKRAHAAGLVDASERTARRAVSALITKGLLVAQTHKSALRLGIPIEVVDRWLPGLYPTGGSYKYNKSPTKQSQRVQALSASSNVVGA